MVEHSLPPDSEFDLSVRAELNMAFDPGAPPASLLRNPRPLWSRRSFQGSVVVFLLAGTGTGAALAERPSSLVRDAIDHERFERSLRGSLMTPDKMLNHIGMEGVTSLPGFTQLLRPCDLDGHLVYHLTTFFEKAGMVTLFAFDQPVTLEKGSGWWNNVFWRVMHSKDGKPVVLIARKKKAMVVASSALMGERG